MKIIFAGTPLFAAEALKALIATGHEIPLVLTQPDRPAGRGRQLKMSEVKELALASGIRVECPETLNLKKGGEATQRVYELMKEIAPDVLVVAAYGLILPQAVLDIPLGIGGQRFPNMKAINIHGSLLPRWRGAAPIARAIEAGDQKTGISLMQMDAGLDTGDEIYTESVVIAKDDTSLTLTAKMAKLGAQMIVKLLAQPFCYEPKPQLKEGICYAAKLSKAESAIEWNLSAQEISNKVRAFNPFPATVFKRGDSEFKCWMAMPLSYTTEKLPGTVVAVGKEGVDVAAGSGTVVRLCELQRPGGKRLVARDFLAGTPVQIGEVLL